MYLVEKNIFRFPNSHEYVLMTRFGINLFSYPAANTESQISHCSYIATDRSFGGYEMLPGVPLSPKLCNSIESRVQAIVAIDQQIAC